MRSWVSLLVFVAFLAVLAGCEKKVTDVKRVRVSGKVTLDDRPLATGSISFDPENGEPPAVFDLLDGRFEGLACVGKNKIRIASIKKISMKEKMKMDGPGYDTMVEENALPARYGQDSQITREVVAEGPNEFTFDTKSK